MRFLIDESCDFAAARALRAAGHDVLAVAEVKQGLTDETVVDLALSEDRILLTEDRDFGQLVYARGQQAGAVVYLRYPASARSGLGREILTLVEQQGGRLIGAFVVVQPGRVRITRFVEQ